MYVSSTTSAVCCGRPSYGLRMVIYGGWGAHVPDMPHMTVWVTMCPFHTAPYQYPFHTIPRVLPILPAFHRHVRVRPLPQIATTIAKPKGVPLVSQGCLLYSSVWLMHNSCPSYSFGMDPVAQVILFFSHSALHWCSMSVSSNKW